MTMDGQPDFIIHRGSSLATVEPLNSSAIKWNLLNKSNVQPNGWFTFQMDYLEDVVKGYQEENFIVEVR